MQRHRKPWAAVLLSLAGVGLGHLYAGRPWRALAVVALVHAALFALLGAQFSAPAPAVFWASAALFVLAFVVAFVDAGIVAARAPKPYVLRRYNRWWVYVAIWIGAAFIWNPVLRASLRRTAIEAFRIPSAAMEPTILVGDYLFADKRPSARGTPNLHDVIIFNSVNEAGVMVIKRVAGVAGDTWQPSTGALYGTGRRCPSRGFCHCSQATPRS